MAWSGSTVNAEPAPNPAAVGPAARATAVGKPLERLPRRHLTHLALSHAPCAVMPSRAIAAARCVCESVPTSVNTSAIGHFPPQWPDDCDQNPRRGPLHHLASDRKAVHEDYLRIGDEALSPVNTNIVKARPVSPRATLSESGNFASRWDCATKSVQPVIAGCETRPSHMLDVYRGKAAAPGGIRGLVET
jgi:hypothetical protein